MFDKDGPVQIILFRGRGVFRKQISRLLKHHIGDFFLGLYGERTGRNIRTPEHPSEHQNIATGSSTASHVPTTVCSIPRKAVVNVVPFPSNCRSRNTPHRRKTVPSGATTRRSASTAVPACRKLCATTTSPSVVVAWRGLGAKKKASLYRCPKK